jgi:8-oxo-dGTP pyrophosphatase MutT (NUDIX family)
MCCELVLKCEHPTIKTWFHASSTLSGDAPVDAAVRELLEETDLSLTVDDLTLLSGIPIRVPLLARQYQHVHVFSASVLVRITVDMRTPAKVE